MNDIDKIVSEGLGKFFGFIHPITPKELLEKTFVIRVNRMDSLFPDQAIITHNYYAKLNLIFVNTYRTVKTNTYISDVELFFDGGITAKVSGLINFLYNNRPEDLVVKFKGLPKAKVSFCGDDEEVGQLGIL
jgi:hypothetical protein